jgi:hypothetical protein
MLGFTESAVVVILVPQGSPHCSLAVFKRPCITHNYVIGWLAGWLALFSPASGHSSSSSSSYYFISTTQKTTIITIMSPLPDFLLDVARNPVMAGMFSLKSL